MHMKCKKNKIDVRFSYHRQPPIFHTGDIVYIVGGTHRGKRGTVKKPCDGDFTGKWWVDIDGDQARIISPDDMIMKASKYNLLIINISLFSRS